MKVKSLSKLLNRLSTLLLPVSSVQDPCPEVKVKVKGKGQVGGERKLKGQLGKLCCFDSSNIVLNYVCVALATIIPIDLPAY